ncbi:MAG: 4,5-DOPA dioxygenase extradiol [Eubacteriaceae bacterium]|nr:4,5-DOPA dioxygenase extradiol [Eubacteriaceae bacterium]
MPVLFVGHGSPMNTIEDNEYTRTWKEIAKTIPKPKAILAVSAHWYTKGTRIMNEATPKMIYDMYGFPEALYKVVYHAPGSPEFAGKSKELISKDTVFDNSWGFDHGTYSVLCQMYPSQDIPVFQISVDGLSPGETHFEIGTQLRSLREQGVLIFGSGNIVHNLRSVDFNNAKGFDWAYDFDDKIKNSILDRDFSTAVHYESIGDSARHAVPTPDHYFPLLYVLGASDESDKVSIYNNSCTMGSLSMTSYLFE